MYSVVLIDGTVINVNATEVEWHETPRCLRFINGKTVVARFNMDNITGWIDTDCKAIAEGQLLSEMLDKISAEIKETLSWEMYDEWGNETALCKSLVEIFEKYKKGGAE